TQCEKGDSLTDGYVSELWDFTRISVTQNNLQELKEIWDQWSDELLHIWKCRFGAYNRRICDFTLMFKVSSRQSLLVSCKCANLFEKADEYYRDERAVGYSTIKQKGDSKCIP
ncbi:hypothetical protein Goshw_028882, partial [Gossypium schwendimanii]|nr:hypothetical protein [Gossypium schwendimanii]